MRSGGSPPFERMNSAFELEQGIRPVIFNGHLT